MREWVERGDRKNEELGWRNVPDKNKMKDWSFEMGK